MTDMKLQKATLDDFDGVYDALEKSFIPEERREREDAEHLMAEGKYTLFHILDGESRVGFITVWELDRFAFVEHFVTYEGLRNRGYGGAALELLKEKYAKIVLEAEPPTEGIAARRVAFYERCGFCRNPQYYYQPSYRKNGNGVELVLMSLPTVLEDFDDSVSEIYDNVYDENYKKQ